MYAPNTTCGWLTSPLEQTQEGEYFLTLQIYVCQKPAKTQPAPKDALFFHGVNSGANYGVLSPSYGVGADPGPGPRWRGVQRRRVHPVVEGDARLVPWPFGSGSDNGDSDGSASGPVHFFACW